MTRRLAEDLRLLYVALTRAQHACWLGVADLKRAITDSSVLHLSALGYLLGGGAALGESAALSLWLTDLQRRLRGDRHGAHARGPGSTYQPPRNERDLAARRCCPTQGCVKTGGSPPTAPCASAKS